MNDPPLSPEQLAAQTKKWYETGDIPDKKATVGGIEPHGTGNFLSPKIMFPGLSFYNYRTAESFPDF